MRPDGGLLLTGLAALVLGGWAAANLLAAPPAAPQIVTGGTQAGVSVPGAPALDALASRFAAPQAGPAPVQSGPAVSLELIGLVETDAGRLAVFFDGSGTQTGRMGDTVDGYRIVALDDGVVRVERGGEIFHLRLQP